MKAQTCPHGITPKKNCKECMRKYNNERSKRWKKKNPEKVKLIKKRSYQKHRKKNLARNKEYYQKHREKLLRKQKEYQKTHQEERRKYNYDYWRKNKKILLEKQKNRYHNPEYKTRENMLNFLRKYRKKLRAEIKMIIGDKCIVCNKEENIHYHEIYGRKHKEDYKYILEHSKDFVPLCGKCHLIIHTIAMNFDKLNRYLKLVKKIREAKDSDKASENHQKL